MTEANKQVVKFDITEAAITALSEKYAKPKVPQNKEEYEVLKVGIKEVADIRIAIDKERKVQNADALAHQREVNRIGNGIIDRLKAIESPMKLCKAEVDDAEERALAEKEATEAARLELIKQRLERIVEYGQVSLNDTLDAVKKRLARVEELDPNDRFDEFAKKAAEAKQASFESLTAAIKQLEEREQVVKQQAEQQAVLDKQRDDQAAEQKVIDDENARIAQEKADKDEADRKEEAKRVQKLEDEEADRQMKEAAEAEEVRQKALAPDKEKLRVFAQSFRDIDPPVMSSDEGKMAIDRVIDQLTVIVSDIESEADRL